MPTKRTYVVRIVTLEPGLRHLGDPNPIGDDLIECLRYAGLIATHHTQSHQCFDLIPPKAIGDSKNWAEQNAKRMQTFGFNAVCAPSTAPHDNAGREEAGEL